MFDANINHTKGYHQHLRPRYNSVHCFHTPYHIDYSFHPIHFIRNSSPLFVNLLSISRRRTYYIFLGIRSIVRESLWHTDLIQRFTPISVNILSQQHADMCSWSTRNPTPSTYSNKWSLQCCTEKKNPGKYVTLQKGNGREKKQGSKMIDMKPSGRLFSAPKAAKYLNLAVIESTRQRINFADPRSHTFRSHSRYMSILAG